MIVVAEALDVTHYTAQYELLRAQVIGSAYEKAWRPQVQPSRGVGLALLLHEGMPGWLKAVEVVMSAALAPPCVPERSAFGRVAPMALPSVQRHDITSLLASLVLSTRPLAGLSPKEG